MESKVELLPILERIIRDAAPQAYRNGVDLVLLPYRDLPQQVSVKAGAFQPLERLLHELIERVTATRLRVRVSIEEESPPLRLRAEISAADGVIAPSCCNLEIERLPGGELDEQRQPGLLGRSVWLQSSDEDNARALRMHLEAFGMTVTEAGDTPQMEPPYDLLIKVEGLNPKVTPEQSRLAHHHLLLSCATPSDEDRQRYDRVVDKTIGRSELAELLLELFARSRRGDASPPILLVEDESINLGLLDEMLRSLGYATVGTQSGSEALAAALKQRFRLAVIDLGLPDIEGIKLARLLKGSAEVEHVITMTYATDTSDEVRDALRDEEIIEHMIKPIDPSQLRETLRRSIGPGGVPITPQQPVTTPYIAVTQLDRQQRLIQQLKKEIPLFRDSLRDAMKQKEGGRLWFIAHKIGGAAELVGYRQLSARAKRLENSATSDDIGAIDSAIEALLEELDHVEIDLSS